MTNVLITGANSFVGTSVEKWLLRSPEKYVVNTIGTIGNKWKTVDFSKYDVVFHVAGIAHVDPKPSMAPLYYKVNRDLTIEIAKYAKVCGVKQFIFMSSMIVYHASKSLNGTIIDEQTKPIPNDFYGDSKLQAERGLKELETDDFLITILRPCMIYGPHGKGNFQRLIGLAIRTPIFPSWHNVRSMLYIDNLCEFVRHAIDRHLSGIFCLQNREYADTVEIVRYFASKASHRILFTRLFNPLVWIGAFVLKPLCKMFANQYYAQELTSFDFDYQIVSFENSLKLIEL